MKSDAIEAVWVAADFWRDLGELRRARREEGEVRGAGNQMEFRPGRRRGGAGPGRIPDKSGGRRRTS